MSACCFCFSKSRDPQTTGPLIKRDPEDHYLLFIQDPELKFTRKSLDSTKPGLETPLESLPDTSSLQVKQSVESIHSVQSNISLLYFPSNDGFLPCSDIVASKFSSFDKILDLEASSDWEIKIEKPFSCIMLKIGTLSHPEIPLLKGFFDMELNADPEDLYKVLYSPDIRKKWDVNIEQFFEITNKSQDVVEYYMHNKAPWPFADRDFVESRFIRKRINGDIEILFMSLELKDYPENKDKAIRGETIIGGQIFRKRISPVTGKPSLYVTTICQADMKGEIPKKLLQITLPSSFLKWYRTVKKQTQIRIQND
ncbi:hypothetical protein SteCoe_29530 [Stentor coeruleus]|uniref:START domain-containing protein n=1 Tax=Stentor coeruleus TaxID=5963 RepID=A0A1R2B5N5_9CILI|nr:hypothetical protein SteCoe_29530 [Stentor coeruleus]